MKRRRRELFIAGCALLLVCSAGLAFFYMWLKVRDQVVISLDSGIYAQGTEVSVHISQSGTVYYTADGRAPFDDWSNVREYNGPLVLHSDPAGTAYSFRFFCRFEDGSFSEIQERNYLVLEDDRQITTDYVVMVQGDDYDLFSDQEGIFVRGNQYYEYWEEHPDVNILSQVIPANYFSDRELEVHAAVFTGDGEEILAQNSGLKICGNWTRAKNQKSFRLIARYDYDEVNEFSYILFDQLVSDRTGSAISDFQRLTLHNAGDDNGYAFIRNTLCNELARQAGFPDVLVSRSATVYVNGLYMGVYWLLNSYDDRYFKEKYGFYQGKMVVCEGTLTNAVVDENREVWEQKSAEAYNAFCSWMLEADMNDPEVWQRVTETVDTENLIQYVALEYYMSNVTDWPHNNVKMYRYIAADGEEYREGTVFDGRYRYLIFDMDYGMGLKTFGWYGREADEEALRGIAMETSTSAGIFSKLMERQECRDAFVIEVLNLRNGVLSEENINRTLDRLNDARWDELEYMMDSTDILKDSLWEADDNSIENVKQELQVIRDFAHTRKEYVLTELANVWDCGSLFQLKWEVPEGMLICINGCPLNAENALYYSNIPMSLSLNADRAGIQVTGWFLNGKYIEGEAVEINPQDYVSEDQLLYVIPEWEERPWEELVISAFSIRGHRDWIRLENVGNTDVYLTDWFISDDADEPFKGRLPNVVLKPGEYITVYGINYEGEKEEVSCQVDFSWNSEEQVILSNLKRGVVESRSR